MVDRDVIRLWLNVRRGPPAAGTSRLWWHALKADHAPRADDTVYVLHDGDFDGAMKVKRVYWNIDGSVHAELLQVYLDPDQTTQGLCDGRNSTAWWTDRDGDLEAMLTVSGWQVYVP